MLPFSALKMIGHEITIHKNTLFACLDIDLHLERIAGGNESEVYRTDDGRFVVKLKNEPYATTTAALEDVKQLRAAAENFAEIVGADHSTPVYFLLASDESQRPYIVIVQPYLKESPALFHIDYGALSFDDRSHVADQLHGIIRRSLDSYWRTGIIPDIYGRSAASPAERAKKNSWTQLPARLWSFLVRRTLLRAHNLLLTPENEIRLVDYDPVRESDLYRRVYYGIRAVLLFRDLFFVKVMKRTGWAY